MKDGNVVVFLWRHAWIYAVLAFAAGVAVLALLGYWWISLLIIVLLFVCPVAIVWGALALAGDSPQDGDDNQGTGSAMSPGNRDHEKSSLFGSRYHIVLIGFLAIGGFYLLSEHRAHFFGALPWLLLLACPLLHVFMHGGHGGHEHRSENDSRKHDQ